MTNLEVSKSRGEEEGATANQEKKDGRGSRGESTKRRETGWKNKVKTQEKAEGLLNEYQDRLMP